MTAPNPFYNPDSPSRAYEVNERLPRSEGGVIESVKRAVVQALRDALTGMDMRLDGKRVYVDLEYPMEEAQYPGIWVQFSPTEMKRAGISHELPVQIEGEWCLIQEWQFSGRVTLSLAAIKSLDRDRLADQIIANLAFARSPDLILTDPTKDAKQYKSLQAALGDNPYVAMTLNTDVIYPGGQDVNPGAPWAGGENTLVYTDAYAVDLQGQFNVRFNHEGIFTLSRIDVEPTMTDNIPEGDGHRLEYLPDGGWARSV